MTTAVINLSDLDGTNGFRLEGAAAGDISGYSVSAAGDVNGDGFDDLIVGAPYADPNGSDSGASYVVFGTSSGFASNLNLSTLNGINGFKLSGAAAGDYSGISVSGAGDVNGDGFDDLIVGAGEAGPNHSGASYVVFGKDSPFAANLNLSSLDGTNGFKLSGATAGDHSGWSVSAAGDVNGDGIDDVIVGAPGAEPNGSESGASYVVFGNAAGFGANLNLSSLDGTNGFKLSGAAGRDLSGWPVSAAGDVNGDGFDDLIIGARFADPNGNDSGASYVVFGRAFAVNVIVGTPDNDTLIGTGGNDQISGLAANDIVNGGAANDTLDGGAGIDTALFSGSLADYAVSGSASERTVSGPDGTDTLTGIERVQFSGTEQHLALDLGPGEAAANTVRIIGAAFDGPAIEQHPDWVGIGLNLFDSGLSMLQVCQLVIGSLGNLTNETFVNAVYQNVVGVPPSPGERDFYVGLLQGSGGPMTQAQLLELAANAPANEVNIDLVGLQASGVEFV